MKIWENCVEMHTLKLMSSNKAMIQSKIMKKLKNYNSKLLN